MSEWWRRLEINRATFYALGLRTWQLFGGAISAVLIAQYFSEEVQGYYYTFAGLMGLQSFFELGFNVVIINVASHEWSGLRFAADGSVTGDPRALSRLAGLRRFIAWWYGGVCLAFLVGVGWGGALFLAQEPTALAWRAPWWSLVALTSALLATLPFNALLEGCNQVAAVNRMRLIQAIAANLAVWGLILLGGGLWAAVAATAARFACDLYLLCVRYGRFFSALRTDAASEPLDWRRELWPLQWRLAVQAAAGYFAFYVITPVMFRYQGAEVAGRMGMTWVLITALQAAAMSWLQTRSPVFGMLISQRRFDELDGLFRRLALVSLGVIACGGCGLIAVIAGLNWLQWPLAERVLDVPTVAVFVLASVVFHVRHCQDIVIRAHKEDPLLIANVLGNCSIGLAIWLCGSRWGPMGAAWGYLAAICCVVVPGYTLVFRRHRREYRARVTRQTPDLP